MKSPRDVFGDYLVEIGSKNKRIVVLNADLATATRTMAFKEKFPDRHFNLGICEQNMMGVGAGLASEGYIPIVSTFAVFATGRAYDQIRQTVAYSNNNVKIMATHPGLVVGADGATHQALEDLSLMRTMPNMVVLAPFDEMQTKEAINVAITYKGPVYIRVGRAEVPNIYDENYKMEIGKGYVLRNGNDICIVSHGIMTYYALMAADKLEEEGISVQLIDMPSIKPIDKELIFKASKKVSAMVTIEDHSIYGGLGSAVAEVVVANKPLPVKIIGVEDTFGESGTPNELYKKYGLDVKSIVMKIKKFYHI